MKKIIYLLILLSLLTVGCGKDNTATNNQTGNIQDENNNGTSDESNGASKGDENSAGPNGDSTQGDAPDENEDTTYVEEIPFDLQIELPEGTTVGDFLPSATVDGTTGWLLENPNYESQREYTEYQDRMLWINEACGWIENHPDDGSYLEDGGPVLKSEFCVAQENGEAVKCGYFCEVTFKIFTNAVMKANGIAPEYSTVDYWCIVYKKEATEFTWVFLEKDFFTYEQAMTVAESLPETELKITIKLKTGYSIQVDPIEGYTIKYGTEYKEGGPFWFKKDGEEIFIGLSRHDLSLLGKTYNEMKEAEDYTDWQIGMSDGSLLIYISGDVGISVYKREARIAAGDEESGDLSGYTDSYVIIWGHRNSSYVYYMNIDTGLGEDEVMKIAEAIHFEFEEPEN